MARPSAQKMIDHSWGWGDVRGPRVLGLAPLGELIQTQYEEGLVTSPSPYSSVSQDSAEPIRTEADPYACRFYRHNESQKAYSVGQQRCQSSAVSRYRQAVLLCPSSNSLPHFSFSFFLLVLRWAGFLLTWTTAFQSLYYWFQEKNKQN